MLRVGFKCSEEEVDDFIRDLEGHVHHQTIEIVRRLFRDINTHLLRKFNKIFKKDETGKTRDWKAIEENQIRELHQKCKA